MTNGQSLERPAPQPALRQFLQYLAKSFKGRSDGYSRTLQQGETPVRESAGQQVFPMSLISAPRRLPGPVRRPRPRSRSAHIACNLANPHLHQVRIKKGRNSLLGFRILRLDIVWEIYE